MNNILDILACVNCKNGKLVDKKNGDQSYIECVNCQLTYDFSDKVPVIIHPNNQLFKPQNYQNLKKKKLNFINNFFPSPSVNLSRNRILNNINKRIASSTLQKFRILVVGCGRQSQELNMLFGKYSFVEIIFCDINTNADVTIFCDAHNLPFFDEIFDCVITTAVLEHVLYPEVVSSEILRVMKIDALLYSEIPFMQQVHEGAYDFTRFTLSGHRRLFNLISEIESGLVAGPATALVWSIEYLLISFSSSKGIQKIIKLIVRPFIFWIKYLDYILARYPQSLDAASCTFIYGIKKINETTDKEIIESYNGVNFISHI